jgi:hypothetical protein
MSDMDQNSELAARVFAAKTVAFLLQKGYLPISIGSAFYLVYATLIDVAGFPKGNDWSSWEQICGSGALSEASPVARQVSEVLLDQHIAKLIESWLLWLDLARRYYDYVSTEGARTILVKQVECD